VQIEYRRVDITDNESVVELINNIKEVYGKLNGIIHSAGVIKDNFIIKKNREEFLQVLFPKVQGLLNLDESTRNLNLDFMILFSSLSAVIGNTGQADYSAANGFMDSYAEYRNRLAGEGKRKGHTLSVNWPLWEDGGLQIDEVSEEILRNQTGMTTMQTENGIRAFYKSFAAGESQVIIIEGIANKIESYFSNIDSLELSKTCLEPDDNFYISLAERIRKSELSKEEFKKILLFSSY
jgi:short-subunit dehydrogenase